MSTFDLGIPQFTDEDAAYQGSRFRDVVDALSANPYQRVWGRAGEPPLPVYDVTFATVASQHFRDAAARTVDSGADLLGPRPQGLPPDRPSQRRLSDRTVADRRRHGVSGYFTKQHRTRHRPLFDVLHGNASRPDTVAVHGRKLFPATDPTTRRRCEPQTS
jgi:hypothetical protein